MTEPEQDQPVPGEEAVPGEQATSDTEAAPAAKTGDARPKEAGGPKGPEPTRFGDWERNGRCVDF